MLTVPELICAMKASGRKLTYRTARNWWSKSRGILPPPQRKGQGQGPGSTPGFWSDDRVLFQAQIAYDLSVRGARLEMVAASLWVLGFNVPLLVVRPAFKHQIVGYYRRVGANLDDLADRIWDVAERFTRTDARIRRGSITDQEGEALQPLMREVLLLLFGVGDDTGEDIAEELIAQINILKPIAMKRSPGNIVPDLHDNDIKYLDEGIYWIRNFAAIARQGEAIASARHHDWVKARRIARLAIGTFARADAALAPQRNVVARALFARTAATFAYALFPILLAVTQDDEERRKIIKTLFSFAVQVRRRAPGAARRERIDAFAGCRPRKSKDSLHLPHDRLETDSDEV